MNALKKILLTLLILPMKLGIFFLNTYQKLVERFSSNLYMFVREEFIKNIDNDIKEVIHGAGKSKEIKFLLYTPNRVCSFRHTSFSEKEPEMLSWIEDFGGEGAFYDIGANIGIYSLYYAKIHSGNVYSFEPSVFNLRQLAKNVSINNLNDQVTIISNPLSDSSGIATFINGNDQEGGALSAFGVNYGFDGKPINSAIKYSVIGFQLDDLLANGVISEPPSIIKIDVDGIEHLILNGSKNILEMESLQSVFIEVNDAFKEQSTRVKSILDRSGFKLREKLHSEMMDKNSKFRDTYNQIWTR